jgi:trimethylamine-N-oxide reductase (cytochrome c)
MIALAAMQGLGKPGSNIYSTACGAPADRDFYFPGYSEGGISGDVGATAAGKYLAARMWPNGGSMANTHRTADAKSAIACSFPK